MTMTCMKALFAAILFSLAGAQTATAGGPEPEGAPDSVISELRQDCEAGDMLACYRLGARYDEGYGIDEDLAQAVAYYRRACDGGSAAGCYGLGAKYQLGEGVERDQARANELIRQACDGGLAVACDNVLPPPPQDGG